MNIFILGLMCLLVEVAAVANDGDTVSVGNQIEVISGIADGDQTVIQPKPSAVERKIRRTGRNIKRELARMAKSLARISTRLGRRAGRMTDAEKIAKIQEKEQEFREASQHLFELSTQLITFFNTNNNGLEELLNMIRPVIEIPSEPLMEEAKRNLKMNHDPLTKLINELKLYT